MAYFQYSSIIPATRHEVFEYHSRLENLISLLAPNIKAVITKSSDPFRKGEEFELRATRYGVSMIWAGVIEDFKQDEYYVDRQTDGPFSLWIHTHRFEDHASGTLVEDLVEYEVPFGLFGKLFDDLYLRRELNSFFEYRHRKTKEHFESDNHGA